MKIVILADSLAMPRGKDVGDIPIEATYPSLLRNLLQERFGSEAPSLHVRGAHRRTIEGVLEDWHQEVEAAAADVVVVHVGVVDCAPRVFSLWQHRIIERIPSARIRGLILSFVARYRRHIILMTGRRVYVPLRRFRSCVSEVVRRAATSTVRSLIFVDIINPPPWLEYRSPGFSRNVSAYNQVLYQHVGGPRSHIIPFNDLIRRRGGADRLTVDGIHIDRQGHELLAAECVRRIGQVWPDSGAATPADHSSVRHKLRVACIDSTRSSPQDRGAGERQ